MEMERWKKGGWERMIGSVGQRRAWGRTGSDGHIGLQ